LADGVVLSGIAPKGAVPFVLVGISPTRSNDMTMQDLSRSTEESTLALRIHSILLLRKDTPKLPFPEAWDRAMFLAIRVLNKKRQRA
jgi:hypothetical protein